MDEIRIKQLEVYAYHGVFPEENEKGQPFYVNAVLYTDTVAAGEQDDLTLSTHYGEVCHSVTKWMQEETFQLIEAVAEKVARNILLHYPLVKAVDVEICKPEAPIGLPFENVSVKIHRAWHTVCIAIGSNMGEREKYIALGIEELRNHPLIRVEKVSELLTTKPYGGVEQDDFINGALLISTILSPESLLQELHRIEALANRERKIHWGPRTLDLDIIFYDKLVYESDTLVIPHVDMENRYFVLKPLSELVPNYRHPVLNRTVNALLQALDSAE